MEKQITTKDFFAQNNVQEKFKELLGKRSSAFITSVLQVVNSNDLLKNAEPMSIYNSAALAATLDLPINNSIGFAYIVPFNQKQKDGSYKQLAQFMLGYKGFIQLAQRSGQFKTISATPIYKGQLVSENPLTGYVFDFTKKESSEPIGYAAYFSLLNGFEKYLYMTVDELKKHGTKYSQTFKKGFGIWKDDFDSMATKTVLKLLLSKYAPLSIDMQKAVIADQSVINDVNTLNVSYADNTVEEVNKEQERIEMMLADCNTVEEVDMLQESCPNFDVSIFEERKKELKGGQNA